MKPTIVLAALLLLASGAALAGPPAKRGAYIGAAVGSTKFDDDGALNGLYYDNQDTGAELWGGYRFLKWFALEAKYAYLGQYRISDGVTSVTAKASALGVSAVFMLQLGDSDWDLLGQIGIASLDYRIDASFGSNSGSQSAGTAGLGVQWTPSGPLTLSLGLDVYSWQENGYYRTYNPSFAITKLGLQYNF